MSGSAAGPIPPAAYSPSDTAAGGPASGDTGEEGGPPPAADSQVAETRNKGLARPRPACLPQRPMGREQVRDGQTGEDRGSTGSDPRWCRACWVPQELGDCAGGQRLWLDRRQQLFKKLLHSCHLLGVRRDCERLPAAGRRERAGRRKGHLITDLRTGAVHDTWISLELDPGGCNNGPELLCRQGPKPYWNHGVQLPMALKDGQVLGTAIGCLWAGQDLQGKASASAQPPSYKEIQRAGVGSWRCLPGGRPDAEAANSSMPQCQPEGGDR